MSARQVSSIAAALIVGCLIGGSLLGQRTAAQVLAPEPKNVGRYQLSAAAVGIGNAYVIDTTTGQVWRRGRTDRNWEDFGSPANKPADKPTDKN
jgi:hypothetical protein